MPGAALWYIYIKGMGVIMDKMLEFGKSELVVILLTIISVIGAENAYLTVIAASLLMIIFCIRSFDDEANKTLWLMQFILSAVYCFAAGNIFAYIIFGELQTGKNKYLRMFLPPAAYICGVIAAYMAYTCGALAAYVPSGIWASWAVSVFYSGNVAEMILNILILQGISILLFVAERALGKYMQAENKYSDIVTVSALNELYEKKLNRELVIKNYLSDKNARMEERENISRNIHNSVGHSITAAIMTLDAADMIFEKNPALAKEKMHVAGDRIRAGLESIRQAVRVLDKSSESISYKDFVGALDTITDNFAMDTGIRIRTDYSYFSEEVMIPHEHAEFLTGALQELLTNGVKHGKADTFIVTLVSDSGHLRMSVADNGAGCAKDENKEKFIDRGFGLKKIASYVSRCGGSTEIYTENGFKFEITLPILD